MILSDQRTMSSTPTTSSEASGSATGGAISTSVLFPSIVSGRHRTLMESLLARKIELAAGGSLNPDRPLIRTDSMDSTSSLGSMSAYGDELCRCDDCLLGIADLYTMGPETESSLTKKKVIGGEMGQGGF